MDIERLGHGDLLDKARCVRLVTRWVTQISPTSGWFNLIDPKCSDIWIITYQPTSTASVFIWHQS